MTIFAVTEYTFVGGQKEQTLRTQYFTTRATANLVMHQWTMEDAARGFVWRPSPDHPRLERMIGDVLHAIMVEEHVVHDEAPRLPQQFDWTYDESIISLTQPVQLKPQSDCMHDNCSNCKGTGQSVYGGPCVHSLVCPCKKCQIYI